MLRVDLPEDVMEYLYHVQGMKKTEKKMGFFSLSKTIAYVTREHMNIMGFKPTSAVKDGQQKEDSD